MTENTTAAKIIARLEVIAGKTMLPGEPGFVLDNLRSRTQELITQWRALGVEGPHGHLRTEGTALWQFAQSVYENAHRYADHIVDAIRDVDGVGRQPAIAAGEFVAPVYSALQHLQEAFANAGSIPEHHFDHIMSYLDMATDRLAYTDSAVLSLLESLKAAHGQVAVATATTENDPVALIEDEFGPIAFADTADERGEGDGDDDTSADEAAERSIPRPPKTGSSRKRPCRKQGGRKQERREASGSGRGPKQRKLNQYALDPVTGLINSVRPGQEIAKGSRVIEQPSGNPKPSIAAFYDATLLPAGSTVVARWGYPPAELDAQLVGRAGRLAKIAGYGDQARSTMFDQIRRSANPNAALEALVLELSGPDALTAEPGILSTTVTREQMPDAVLRAVNAGNEKLVELAENLPPRLAPEQRLVDALSNLPVRIESLKEEGDGCILRVRSMDFSDKARICGRFRAAGGYNIDVQNTRVEKDGKSVRAFTVEARFRVSVIEIAAARTGRNAEVSYHLADDGSVNAEYGVDLYGTRVTTRRIPCEPSWASVEMLVDELERLGDTHTKDLLTKLAIEFDVPAQALVASIGPVRTLEQAREAIKSIRAEDIMTEGYADEVATAAREIRATDGRRIPVEYRGGAAVLAEFSFHPTDIRPSMLPGNVLVGEEEIPTRVRRVRFETKKGSNRPRIVVEETEITELAERHGAYLEGKDLKKVLLTEVRENFIAEATRSMTTALVNPPDSLAAARNPNDIKRRVISKHLDPYAADGGELVHLVEVLAARAGDVAWSRWCRENVKAFRDDARERRKQHREPATDFFNAVGAAGHAKSFLIEAGAALLANRLGRDVTTEEFVEIAREARVTKEHVFVGIDRGRALAQYIKSNS